MAVAGNLEVQVTLAIARLEQEMSQVRKIVGDGMREVAGHTQTAADSTAFLADALKVVGAAFSAREIVSQFMDVENAIRSTGEAAKSVGLSLSDFQGFAYAFKASGVETETFNAAMGRLDKSIADAAGGSKTAQAIFKALGVAYEDGSHNARDLRDVLLDVAEAMHTHADGAAKTQIMLELMGRGARTLVPAFNEGAAAMQALSDRMGLVGGKIGEDAVDKAHKFGAELALLEAQGTVLKANLFDPIVTGLEETIRHFNDARAAGEDCVTANAYSKAVLRVVAGELCASLAGVDYFPAYEIIASAGSGGFAADGVHVRDELVREMTEYMVRQYAA